MSEPDQHNELRDLLRARIDEAMRSFTPEPPRPLAWLMPKLPSRFSRLLPKSSSNALAFQQVAIKGLTRSVRTGVVATLPLGVIYQVGAEIGLTPFEEYFNRTFEANLTATRAGADALSFRLIEQDDVAAHYKQKVAEKRHCIRATIYAVAELIELQNTPLAEPPRQGLEPAKQRQAEALIDETHRWRTSYRSMATGLSLFVQENKAIVGRLREAQKDGSPELRRLFQLNAVFAYEVSDVIIGFLRAFALQGVPELRRLHAEMKGEISTVRGHLSAIETEVSSARTGNTLPSQSADASLASVAARRGALNMMQDHWDKLMKAIDDSETSATRLFPAAIQRLEIIKLEAQANLGLGGISDVTGAVQGNFLALHDMLNHIGELEVVPITERDINVFLNIGTAADRPSPAEVEAATGAA